MIAFHLRLLHVFSSCDLQKQDHVERGNLLQEDLRKEQQIINACRVKIVNYYQLKNVAERLSSSLTLPDTTKTLSDQVNQFYGHDDLTVILYLFHSKTGELGISSSQKGQWEINIKAKKGDLFDQWIAKTMKPLLVEDIRSDFRFDISKFKMEEDRRLRSLMSVPLMIGSKAIGILRVDSSNEEHFSNEDIRLLSTIADLGAIAIENAQLYERVQDLATHDSLTGLLLKRQLLERLSQEMSRQLVRKKDLAFLMIDLDHFKRYNDTFGHIAGDIVLKTLGTLLTEFFHDPGNLIFRYGGEEFSVLLTDCPKKKAMKLAEEFRQKVAEQTIVLRREKTKITVSIGIASFPEDAQLKEDLIQKADQALYVAKAKGRNQVVEA